VTQFKTAKNRQARQRLGERFPGPMAVPLVLAATLVVGSCDGSIRKTGWFIGGEERRIVGTPTTEKGETPTKPDMGAKKLKPETEMTDSKAIRSEHVKRPATAATVPQKVERVIGTGSFVNDEIRPRKELPTAPGGSVTLNFVDAEVRDVIKTVLSPSIRKSRVPSRCKRPNRYRATPFYRHWKARWG
jgi:hypothetical protein